MKFEEIKSHLAKYTVGIAGAGGLGSNCAVALARTGIGKLIVSDFDVVEISNLNRQYYFTDQLGIKKVEALRMNIGRINPETEVIIHDQILDPENILDIYKDAVIIVEAFDRSDMKEMLAETVIGSWPEKTLVIGSGMAGWGKTNLLRERYVGDRLIVCGDESTEISDELPPLAARVGIVANMQANVVIDVLLKMKLNEDNTK